MIKNFNLKNICCISEGYLSGPKMVVIASTIQKSVKHADAVISSTESEVFTEINCNKLFLLMRKASLILNPRLIFDLENSRSLGISFWSVGEAN